jgi:TolA-binding protein
MKDHLRSRDYASVAVAFEERATATKFPRLRDNLLKLARINGELAEQAEQRQLFREVSRRRSAAP